MGLLPFLSNDICLTWRGSEIRRDVQSYKLLKFIRDWSELKFKLIPDGFCKCEEVVLNNNIVRTSNGVG